MVRGRRMFRLSRRPTFRLQSLTVARPRRRCTLRPCVELPLRRAVALLLAACGPDPKSVVVVRAVAAAVAVDESRRRRPQPQPVPTTSPLSGREGGVDTPVMVVKYDNTPAAQPHRGLTSADVVYVEPVEWGLTRLAAVFSTDLPEAVGPVRSARISDIDLLRAVRQRRLRLLRCAAEAVAARSQAADWIRVSSQDIGSPGFYREHGTGGSRRRT